MKKRILALLLCAVTLLSMTVLTGAAATGEEVALSAYAVTIRPDSSAEEKTVVTAQTDRTGCAYQWQIEAAPGLWVDISGMDAAECSISYALVASVLSNGQARLRCRCTWDDAEAFSDELTVSVNVDVMHAALTARSVLNAPARILRAETELPAAPQEDESGKQPVETEGETGGETGGGENGSPEPMSEEGSSGTDTGEGGEPNENGANGGSDVRTTYSIVINYKFEDDKIVADPYVATLAAGENFSTIVTFPTQQGYLPYVGEEQKNTYELNVTAISEDMTVNVVYKPTNVNYTVIHYQQNVDNDNYTETERETKQGLTGSQVPSVAKNYEGFYALMYEQPAIAADGSTVIEIYYDRCYYLMNFDLDGGYGVEPVYARYGTPIAVGAPTRPGYAFAGWDGPIPAAMPAENTKFTATWRVNGQAKVTVVVWGENADDEKYSFYKDAVIQAEPGEKLTLDDLQGKLICGKEEHTHDSCGMNCEHNGAHTRTLACYGITSTPVDPNNGYGDNDARTHFEDNCNNTNFMGSYTCKGLKTYLKDGSVCQYDNGYRSSGIGINHEYFYFLYFGGQYYEITQAQYERWKTNTGKKVEHGNDTYYVYEGKTEVCTHTHTDECYTCGMEEHTHTSACYYNASFMENPDLWELVRSDDITVAADGTSIMNVYYDRVEFTLTFRDGNETVATIKAKWGAQISGEFGKHPFNTTYSGRAWKCTDPLKYNYALQTLDRMPKFDATFNLYSQNSSTKKTIYYYVQKVGTTVSSTEWPTGTANFELLKEVNTYFRYATYNEEYHEIEGFTRYAADVAGFSENKKDFSNNRLNLYYMRNNYELSFFNHDAVCDEKKTVPYEAVIKDNTIEPAYPKGLEPGAYVFEGWYTDPHFKNKVTDATKMPAADVMLYAKWVPKTHTVTFYLTRDAMNGDIQLGTHKSVTVPHGALVSPPPAEPVNGSYNFVGWFYLDDDGTEKAIDFADMPIRKDLKVYAKWNSNTLVSYTVRYVLQGTGTEVTEVAAATTGSGLAGNTKTFSAKGGTELYADYREGYFPTVQSQSLTLSLETGSSNSITFEYVPAEAVPYTVKYINTETGTNVFDGVTVADKVVNDNRKAVVTETFQVINGYMPDAYQKRLVVTVDGENILYFYYTKDTQHAYYKITHYTQNLDGTSWTEYASSQIVGDIGTEYSAATMTIPGFTWDEKIDGTCTKGELTANGLELKLYYVRNTYPYQVRYLEQGTGRQLAEPKNGEGKYGQIVSEEAKDITGYDKVEPSSATLNIRIETVQEGEAPALNVITFYYTEQTVEIKYVVVGPDGCGTLDNYQEAQLKVITGVPKGSTPTAASGYKFVGWFKDEDCTQAVDDAWVTTGDKLTPGKTKNYGTEAASVMGYEGATYYAKFEADVADLTITKSGAEAIDENQSFVFRITGKAGTVTAGVDMEVVIHGEGSVKVKGLQVGEYTVTEVTDWSWRYTPDRSSKSVTLSPGGATVTFTNKRTTDKWLSGSAYADNNWAKGSADKSN